ncbi:MAG: glycosyltransferase family 39 protein [Clostridiales bacterium]|nr:glycosyltransferase family 39 protein [Clostridiales bacterium]
MQIINWTFIALFSITAVFYLSRTFMLEGKNIKIRQSEKGSGLSRYEIIALAAAAAIAVILRLVMFGTIPCGVNQDEAMAGIDAYSLSRYGTDHYGTFLPAHLYAWGKGQMSSLMSYCMVSWIMVFGLETAVIRIPTLLLSIAGLGGLFFLMRKLLGRDPALFALFFASINPWHFMQSRWALDCNYFPHLFIIGSCLLVYGIENRKLLYASMIFFAGCMYSYGVAFYTVPLFLIISSVVLCIHKKARVRDILICIAIYLALAWPICTTMIINFLKIDTVSLPFVTMQYFDKSIRMSDLAMYKDYPIEMIIISFRSFFEVSVFQADDLPWNAINSFGSLYKMSIPLVILGFFICLFKSIKEKDTSKKIIYILTVVYGLCVFVTGMLIVSSNINRINIAFYANMIYAVTAIYFISARIRYFRYIAFAVYTIFFGMFAFTYFTKWAEESKGFYYHDFVSALEYADSLDCDRYYITIYTEHNVSEVLTLYTMKIDAKYYQGVTDSWDGKDIPYTERFIYGSPEETSPVATPGVAMIVTDRQLEERYELSGWDRHDFGFYNVMTPSASQQP